MRGVDARTGQLKLPKPLNLAVVCLLRFKSHTIKFTLSKCTIQG